jgi:hypothetical protein
MAMGYRQLPDRNMWAKPLGFAVLTWHDEKLLCLRGTRDGAPVIFDSVDCTATTTDDIAEAEASLQLNLSQRYGTLCAFLTDIDRRLLLENLVNP